MKYIVKHNIPHFPHKEMKFAEKDKESALFLFRHLESKALKAGYPVKSILRENENKPLRATLQVEVDNFMYYAELYAQ